MFVSTVILDESGEMTCRIIIIKSTKTQLHCVIVAI